jgi:hypothetical protein
MTRRLRSAVVPLSLLAASLLPLSCGGDTSSPPAVCGELTAYTSTVPNQLSFATDIYPIFASTVATGAGCSQVGACHGNPPLPINSAGTKTLQYLYSPENPAMARSLMVNTPSVNASGMMRVLPGNVGQSLLSYKISGKDGLSCISSMCQGGASVGKAPCGDAMPTIGMLTAADRTKILDWIATGASD